MLRSALAALAIALTALGCAHAKIPDAASGGDVSLFGSKFDADEIDVTVDWQAGPPVPKNERAGAAKLTASDGSGLRLISYEARAVLYGPLAFSEVHLVFENPSPDVKEGTFSITLPDGATVSRFAMRLSQGWQEGEVVERQAARQTFESFLHRKVDPAMLETDGGNVFRGRVFPIFGNQRKEIVIAYTETFAQKETPYKLPLAGLPAVDQLDVQLLVPSQRKAFVLHRRNEAPEHDFTYLPPPGGSDLVRGGRYAIARVSSSSSSPQEQSGSKIDSLAVLVDSSASRAASLAADMKKVENALLSLGVPESKIKIASFDQEVDPASSLGEVAKRRAGGASNLGAGLKWLATTGAKRAFLVTDGEATTGPRGAGALAAKVQELRGTGIERVDAIAVGGAHANKSILKSLVTAGLAKDGVVVDGSSLPPESIARSLRAPSGTIRKAEVPGASRVFPTSLATKGSSGASSALAFVELPDEKANLRVAINGKSADAIQSPEETAPPALIERAFVQEQIRELEIDRTNPAVPAQRKKAIAQEIIDLSIRHRILTSLTAMLVLETESDYARFRIPRDAMKDIPVVGPRGVEIVPRGGGHVLVPPSVAAKRAASGLSPDEADASMDRDADGIPDMVDRCPDEPEVFNGFQDEDGCPDRGMVMIDSNHIIILQQVRFATGSATILKESNELLDMLAITMVHHPEFDLIGVYGHTDNRGDPNANQLLSEQRALAVRDALIARGVKASRLVAKGLGGIMPMEPGASPEALAKNRRVELKILRINGEATGIDEGPPAPALKTPPGPAAATPVTPNMQHFRGKAAPRGEPLEGKMSLAQKLIDEKKPEVALSFTDEWIRNSPDDMLAWIAQGRAFEALHRSKDAARAYGSLIDLAGRTEHRRAAAGFLESVAPKYPNALEVAIDAYKTALDERKDQPSSHRLYAWSLARAGRYEEALDVTLAALKEGRFDPTRFPSVTDALRKEAGIFAMFAARKLPAKERDAFLGKAAFAGATIPKAGPTTTLILTWENDETDLDLLAFDPQDRLSIPSVDARNGYGPELLTLEGPLASMPSIRLEVQQVNRGPAGFVFGKVAIVRHDGAGASPLQVEDRPFVIMNPGAAAKLGTLTPLQPAK